MNNITLTIKDFREGIYTDYKLEFWGIIAPILITLLFQSIVAGIAIVVFASVMFLQSGKKTEAKTVVKYASLVLLTFLLSIFFFGALAAFS